MDTTATLPNDHKTFHLSESSDAQYIIAVVVAGMVYYSVIWYTKVASPELAAVAINRGMSMGTLVLLGIVLLLGPMTRMFGGAWRTLFIFRKELGVVAFVTGITHVYLSMFVFARSSPFGFYIGMPWSAYPGLVAMIIMAVLCFFSFHKTQSLLPPAVWWKMQYMGARTAFFGIMMHVVVLRYDSWLMWMQGEPALPPAALLGTVFAAFVLVIRLIDFSKQQTKQAIASAATFGFIAVTVGMFVPVIISSFS